MAKKARKRFETKAERIAREAEETAVRMQQVAPPAQVADVSVERLKARTKADKSRP